MPTGQFLNSASKTVLAELNGSFPEIVSFQGRSNKRSGVHIEDLIGDNHDDSHNEWQVENTVPDAP